MTIYLALNPSYAWSDQVLYICVCELQECNLLRRGGSESENVSIRALTSSFTNLGPAWLNLCCATGCPPSRDFSSTYHHTNKFWLSTWCRTPGWVRSQFSLWRYFFFLMRRRKEFGNEGEVSCRCVDLRARYFSSYTFLDQKMTVENPPFFFELTVFAFFCFHEPRSKITITYLTRFIILHLSMEKQWRSGLCAQRGGRRRLLEQRFERLITASETITFPCPLWDSVTSIGKTKLQNKLVIAVWSLIFSLEQETHWRGGRACRRLLKVQATEDLFTFRVYPSVFHSIQFPSSWQRNCHCIPIVI